MMKNFYFALFVFAAVLGFAGRVGAVHHNHAMQQHLMWVQQEQMRQHIEHHNRVVHQSPRAPAAKPDADKTCPRFDTITVTGSNDVSERRIRRVVRRYVGRCVTQDNMAALQNEIVTLFAGPGRAPVIIYIDQERSSMSDDRNDIVFVVERFSPITTTAIESL